jgi:hypothetical protein
MISDSGIWYPEPIEKRIVTLRDLCRPKPIMVRWRTWICDHKGEILRKGQEGLNMITDYGMDQLATTRTSSCIDYCVISSQTLGSTKRVMPGGTTLSLTSVSDPTNVPVVASANFFAPSDVGHTLYIDGLDQELKIIAYTDEKNITCATRPGVWLPGITPTLGPFSSAGVHFTANCQISPELARFNSYDTGAPNYKTELTDYTNQRFIHQRIFLSGAAGSPWTINWLAWSGSASSGANLFGVVALTSPDTVAVGQKYRVQVQLFSGYTPINTSSFTANWGPTIGTYDLAIRTEVLVADSLNSNGTLYCFLRPYLESPSAFGAWTNTFTLYGPTFQGDPGFPSNAGYHGAPASSSPSSSDVSQAAYISGQYMLNRTTKLTDTWALSSVTGLVLAQAGGGQYFQQITLKPNSGTITKPSGYWAALTFPVYWTRALVN